MVSHANRNSGIFYPLNVARVEYDIGEAASLAGQMLLDLIRNPALPPQTAVLHPRLVLPGHREPAAS